MDSALDILVCGIPAVLLVMGLTEVIKRIGLRQIGFQQLGILSV